MQAQFKCDWCFLSHFQPPSSCDFLAIFVKYLVMQTIVELVRSTHSVCINRLDEEQTN